MRLRIATADDAAEVAAIYAPIVRETTISFELTPPSVDAIADRIRAREGVLPWLVASDAEGCRGYAYADPHRARAAYRFAVEVSVYVEAGSRRRGVGTALYTALLELLCLQGHVRAFAGIALPNPASVAMHEALGFAPVGVYAQVGFKHGRWWDVGWWQYAVRPAIAEPDEPRPLSGIDAAAASEVLERAAALVRPGAEPAR